MNVVKMFLRTTSGIMMLICGLGVLVWGTSSFVAPMRDYLLGVLLLMAGFIIIKDSIP
jgi:uncharacterized membrane protein HdeD (DUF308 family)